MQVVQVFLLSLSLALVNCANPDPPTARSPPPPPPILWALHENCQTPKEQGAAIEGAVVTLKRRSAVAAKRLRDVNNDKPDKKLSAQDLRVRQLGKMLLGEADWKNDFKNAANRFDLYSTLTGPVDRKDVKAFPVNENTYRNFIISCKPELGQLKKDRYENPYSEDLLRKRVVQPGNELWTIRDEAAKKIRTSGIVANTQTDVVREKDGLPQGDRKTVPEVITFHPQWFVETLEAAENKKNKENAMPAYDIMVPQKLVNVLKDDAVKTFASDTPKGNPYTVTPIDSLRGLEGAIHHETFHLTVFGDFRDVPTEKQAYGWLNVVAFHRNDNPENYAYLALAIEVSEQGYAIGADGGVTRP